MSKYFYFSFLSLFVATFFCFYDTQVFAQEKQVLSVTPPLFELTALPGDMWQSSVKVVNDNAYPLTIYIEVVNFEAEGEAGRGKFISVPEGSTDNASLAEWVHVMKGPYTIPPEQTQDITFYAEIPKNAAPGGHYAALLISTEEPAPSDGFEVRTAQVVTSLLFLRVEGDIREEGTVREFRVLDRFLSRPEAEFLLRFENKGNVHLQPRGDIVISNMWGTERGRIPINYQTHFGNVLPKSIREFSFSWTSDFEITDIGLYKAIVTLGYGENGIKSTTSATYFWVIPIKWTLITISVVVFFVWLITQMVRAYVRRMLTLAGVDVDQMKKTDSQQVLDAHVARISKQKPSYRTVSAPIRDGVLDLRKRLDTAEESLDVVTTVFSFVSTYKMFFISVAILVGIFVSITLYIGKATEKDNNYQIQIKESDTTTTLTDDEVKEITDI